jgi:membrane associated rhomboid family serine protease
LLNAAIFLLQTLLGAKANFLLVQFLGLSRDGLESGMVWQVVTHMFLHGGILHLAVNMLGLWFVGQAVERWVGGRVFLLTYFIGGVLGGLLQVVTFPSGNLIGASGGVCAILLMFTTLEPEMPITALLFFVLPVRLRAKYLGYGVLGVSLLLPLLGLDPHVGHFAHLGGGLVGMAGAIWLRGRGLYRSHSGGRGVSVAGPEWAGARTARWSAPGPTAEIDRILNKVVRDGLHSLSPEERQRIEEWSRQRGQGA